MAPQASKSTPNALKCALPAHESPYRSFVADEVAQGIPQSVEFNPPFDDSLGEQFSQPLSPLSKEVGGSQQKRMASVVAESVIAFVVCVLHVLKLRASLVPTTRIVDG